MSRYFDRISAEKLEKATSDAKHEIGKEIRRARALRAIAENLDGAYVTKRLTDKLQALIPDADRVFISDRTFCGSIELHFSFPDTRSYDDYCVIRLCWTDTRRIVAADLIRDAEHAENKAADLQERLDVLPAAADLYNDLADRYARVYAVMEHFLYGYIPLGMSTYSKTPVSELFPAPEAEATPEADPDPDPEPARAPIPLPVRRQEDPEPVRLTFDEFAAMVSGS